MQERFYLPNYHKFSSVDPGNDQHFNRTQSWNIYSYVMNNPIKYLDPDGMELKSSAADAVTLLPMLNKLAKGGKVEYDPKTSTYSISGSGGSKGFDLVKKIIANKNVTEITIDPAGSNTAAPNGSDSSIVITGKSQALPEGNRGQSPEAIMMEKDEQNVVYKDAPAYILLGHELIHADHQMNSDADMSTEIRSRTRTTKDVGKYGAGDYKDEYRTVGLPGAGGISYNKPGDITENDLRKENKISPRVAYDTRKTK